MSTIASSRGLAKIESPTHTESQPADSASPASCSISPTVVTPMMTPRLGRVSPNFTLSPAISLLARRPSFHINSAISGSKTSFPQTGGTRHAYRFRDKGGKVRKRRSPECQFIDRPLPVLPQTGPSDRRPFDLEKEAPGHRPHLAACYEKSRKPSRRNRAARLTRQGAGLRLVPMSETVSKRWQPRSNAELRSFYVPMWSAIPASLETVKRARLPH